MTTVVAKKALRASLRTTLRSLSPSEIDSQSTLVTSHVTSHPAFQRAKTVSCYLSMPSGELDTSHLVRSILKAGKILFVPRIDPERGEMEMLRVYDELDLSSLPSGTWGIREPNQTRDGDGHRRANVTDPDSPVLDLILLPGLAFDHTLSRLGHGKGYYDRFLTAYQSRIAPRPVGMPILLGLALTPQLLDPSHDPIPMTDHDWKVDGVIYPVGLVGEQEVRGKD